MKTFATEGMTGGLDCWNFGKFYVVFTIIVFSKRKKTVFVLFSVTDSFRMVDLFLMLNYN